MGVAVEAAELALESLADARKLLEPSSWADVAPVSLQPPWRTVWCTQRPAAPGGGHSRCDREMVTTVRSVGRVRGASVGTVSALLMDSDFHTWRRQRRELRQEIVRGQLTVVREMVLEELGAVPSIQRRELSYLCTQAEEPGGGRLLIERSFQHSTWPVQNGAACGWQFSAMSVAPVLESGSPHEPSSEASLYGSVPPSPEPHAAAAGGPAEPDVELCLIHQLDLGGTVVERFAREYALERSDLLSALTTYMALPTWERVRARLDAEGPKSPPPIANLSPKSHTRRSSSGTALADLPTAVASGTPSDGHATAEKRGKGGDGKHVSSSRASTGEQPLPKGGNAAGGAQEGEAPGYMRAEVIDPPMVAIDSALHRAQVLALAQLRVNPNATR